MAGRKTSLIASLEKSLNGPVQAEAAWLANKLAKSYNGQVSAVLYYGSCLRTGKIDGMILDFYLIVQDYKLAYGKTSLALANRVLPPNVFFVQEKKEKKTIRAKVAVLSLDDFLFRTSERCLNVSVWARFSQPARLIYCRDAKTREAIIDGVRAAHLTMVQAAVPTLVDPQPAGHLWPTALGLTYGAELRSEKAGKGEELYQLNKPYFDAMTPLIFKELEGTPEFKGAKWMWFKRRANGKVVSLLRLIKATFTFAGGIDYLVWKIERSSGVKVTLKPWQRRHPLLAGLLLFLQLRLKGAFR